MSKIQTNYIPNIGLASVLIYIGCMKFTAYEAGAIAGLISNSPLMSWVYDVLSQRTTATLIGISELAIAGLILLQPWKPKLSFFGGLGAIGMLLTTLSFLFTTPGVWEKSLGGFPALSVMPGQFMIKDLALISIAIWVTLNSKKAATDR